MIDDAAIDMLLETQCAAIVSGLTTLKRSGVPSIARGGYRGPSLVVYNDRTIGVGALHDRNRPFRFCRNAR